MARTKTAVLEAVLEAEAAVPGPLTAEVRDVDGVVTHTVVLPAEVFDAQVNIPLMHQVVVAQLAAARQGTHSTKTRGEVRGGGRKPYRQKGTGRARQGSTRAPQFTGGGVVHGPTPRDYSQRIPKKMKRAALFGALSDRARDSQVLVVDGFLGEGMDEPFTQEAILALDALTDARRVMVVVDRDDELSVKSLRNVRRVHLIFPDQLNTYDVLVNDTVVFTTTALRDFLVVEELALTEVAQPEPADDEDDDADPDDEAVALREAAEDRAALREELRERRETRRARLDGAFVEDLEDEDLEAEDLEDDEDEESDEDAESDLEDTDADTEADASDEADEADEAEAQPKPAKRPAKTTAAKKTPAKAADKAADKAKVEDAKPVKKAADKKADKPAEKKAGKKADKDEKPAAKKADEDEKPAAKKADKAEKPAAKKTSRAKATDEEAEK